MESQGSGLAFLFWFSISIIISLFVMVGIFFLHRYEERKEARQRFVEHKQAADAYKKEYITAIKGNENEGT